MQIYAGQDTYQRLGIDPRWWFLLDLLDDAARSEIESAVILIQEFDFIARAEGQVKKQHQKNQANEKLQQVQTSLSGVFRRIGASAILGGCVLDGCVNKVAAQSFIRRYEAHLDLPFNMANDRRLAYKRALQLVNVISEHVQDAEGCIGNCIAAGIYAWSLFLCHNIGNIVVSIPAAWFGSTILNFMIDETHREVLKLTVAGGLCARFERAVFNAVTTEALVNTLRISGYGAAYSANSQEVRRMEVKVQPVCTV